MIVVSYRVPVVTGTYTVVFEVTATTASGSAVTTGQKTYTFTVQP
jgi:surface-anchored protein